MTALYIGSQRAGKFYDSTIFISIGSKISATTESTILDSVEASDKFTETVHGWFKNPAFIATIDKDVAASKQEKQNLFLNYETETEQEAINVSNVIKQQLQNKIAIYNAETESDFTLAIYDFQTKQDNKSFLLYLILGLFSGIFFGIFYSYMIEYFLGVVSHRWQAERIINKKVDDIIRNNKVENYNLSFILALIKGFDQKSITIAGIDFLPSSLETSINESSPKINIISAMFPDDAVNIADHPDNPIIIVCKIGKSRLDSLHKIRQLLGENVILLTKE